MKIIFITYLVMVHVFLGLIIVKTDIVSRIQAKLGFEVLNDELTPHYHMMLAFHRRVDQNVPDNSVIFIGDSLIEGLAVSAVSPESINFGIGLDTTVGVIRRLPFYKSISRAKAVVIAIGINDLKRRDTEEILKNYEKIIGLIPSTIPILFSAVLPVDELVSKNMGFNERILKLNKGLSKICVKNPRLYLLDIGPLITASNGNLLNSYNIGDGIHLNSLGNEIWISNLKKWVLKINSIKHQEEPN